MNRLILGKGIFRRDGWKTLDADPKMEPDIVATIPPLPSAVKATKWDDIEWIHGISSLYPWDAKQILADLYGVMRPGGRLTLEQPNFQKILERAHVAPVSEVIAWAFGNAEEYRNPLLMNRWGYTPETLAAALHQAGFRKIDVLPAIHHKPERDFRIEAFA